MSAIFVGTMENATKLRANLDKPMAIEVHSRGRVYVAAGEQEAVYIRDTVGGRIVESDRG